VSGRKLADFIEKRVPLGQSKRQCDAQRSSEGLFHVKQSDAISLVEWRRSYAHKRTIRTSEAVNCAGDHSLRCQFHP